MSLPAARGWLLLALAVITVGTTACEPTCRASCRKVFKCDDALQSDGVVMDECEASCVFQQRQYEEWGDEAKENAFVEHKRCLAREDCDAIAEGVCYDESVYLFETETPE